ncbi:MAG: histidine kinase [Pseudonocardiaceae bacterium]
MNVRKITAEQMAEATGSELDRLLAAGTAGDWPDGAAAAVARVLRIEPEQITASRRRDLTVLTRSAVELRDTRRPIQRDGIHFYNYYTMAAPPGAVAPVILDILCPADRIPALNNGHLEPAITVNLGPGDIHGRWGTELTDATWQVMRANSGPDDWIVGDSYVEPSYCPHSYSLTSGTPARIVSYTGQSNLATLLEDINDWATPAADALFARLDDGLTPSVLAELLLARRGHTVESAAAVLGIPGGAVTVALDGGDLAVLRDLGRTFGFDYRLLLWPEWRRDSVGKTYCDIDDCRKDVRRFQGYEVASMASAPHLPDLTGLFVRIDGDSGAELREPAETHYLVTRGEVVLDWTEADGTRRRARLDPDSTAWVGPFVAHRWSGNGALVKLGSGRHLNYLDLIELANTYAAAATLRRGRRDGHSWGYDS